MKKDEKRFRLVLISPRGPLYRKSGGIWQKSLRYAPLTLTTLAALVPQELNAEIVLVDEGIQDIDRDIEADLIGISIITGTAPRGYELAAHFRQRGIPVVLGGVHVTLMPDEAQKHANSIVIGYAEETFPQLLYDFVKGEMQPCYHQTRPNMAKLPHPRRDMLNPRHYSTIYTVEATRGCIHQCEFCVVPAAWGKPLQKPVGDVVEEIRAMGSRRLLFLDLNLIGDLDYAKEFFKALIPLKLMWGGLATTMIAWDEELLDLTRAAGCRGLLIGFETTNNDALVEMNKRFNNRHDYFEVVRRLHERGIAIQGTFMFGLDSDDKTSFERTVDFVMDANIDLPRYAVQTPFPNTALFHRLKRENRILTEDWTQYDGQHVVYQPKQMSPQELLLGTEWAWKKTYSIPAIAKRLIASRTMLPIAIPANFGYRFYAHRLHQYYNCDSMISMAS
jgi:radical SAM superfamily enzyme YgiQ (UPF0313 family)